MKKMRFDGAMVVAGVVVVGAAGAAALARDDQAGALGAGGVGDAGDAGDVGGADALDETLALVGMRREDLGWRPKGSWEGFPADIPYKTRQFDAIFAEPLSGIQYVRTMANAARGAMLADATGAAPDRASSGALYRLVARLGVARKCGQFRSYSCNLTGTPTPLDEAVLRCYAFAGRQTGFVTFGQESPYPLVEADVAEAVEAVPERVRPIIGKLIENVLDAHRWVDLAWRNVPLEQRLVVARRLDLGAEAVDALEYCPEADDVARNWDEPSLWYAGLKCVEALDEARHELEDVPAEEIGDFAFDWRTPLGWIRVRGTGDDVVDGDETLLVVDLGGDDAYRGAVAASTATRPIGLLLDMGGNDTYTGESGAQGAGLCGIGVLLDVRGDDVYAATQYAQGAGQFGLGVCIDLAGTDTYVNHYSGQGFGIFGIGLHVDAGGDDRYTLWADGQGYGGCAGVGVLADGDGDDSYEAVRDAAITGRPSYHSDGKISVSNAQGCAMGRRGDGADGHSWAGGIGALVDLRGDDRYVSGNWSQGTGYWFGMGFLYDGEGDDEYHGVVWSQATGAHFCVGILVDEAGDDLYAAEESSRNSIAFGHDFAIALLADFAGDDVYETESGGLGFSINRSVAMLIDAGGDDVYRGSAASRPGAALPSERFSEWDGYSTYFAEATSIGLFLDVGGHDRYEHLAPDPARHRLHPLTGGEPQPAGADEPPQGVAACADDTTWLDPPDSASSPDSSNMGLRNYSVGVDRSEGTIDWRPAAERAPAQ